MTQNIRQELTDKFVAAIENGCPPWRAGWTMASPPMNPSTDRPYTGLNRLILMQAVADCGGEYRFMTLKQASAQGYKIRAGAKAFRIVRVAEVDRKPDEAKHETKHTDGEVVAEEKGKRLILRVHHVFNGNDIEGLPPVEKPSAPIEPVEAAQQVVDGMKATGLVVLEGGDKACYMPKADTIRMPDRWRFKGGNNGTATAEWWATLLHECGHSTMHQKRMDRQVARFGTEGYAREELRAEIAAAFLCQELGIPMATSLLESHSSYLTSWASLLRGDQQEIIKAASDAQKIADYLKAHAVKPVAATDNKVELVAASTTAVPVNVIAAAVNQESPKRRRAGMRM
jgi:antirestriction protein ArdC